MEYTMTNKEFFEKVINAKISAEVTEKAEHLLKLANGRTDKRAEQATANQSANLKIFNNIAVLMSANTTYAVSEIKELLTNTDLADLTTSKISAVFKLATEKNLVTAVSNYKVGGKGRAVKGYTLAETEIEVEVTED